VRERVKGLRQIGTRFEKLEVETQAVLPLAMSRITLARVLSFE
jgi:hypothetical protein